MTTLTKESAQPDVLDVDRVTIRFAGDSGDGMQLTGTQFTKTSAVFGNDISTDPDIPAEIRAPQGSLPGVSAFQVSCFFPIAAMTSSSAKQSIASTDV